MTLPREGGAESFGGALRRLRRAARLSLSGLAKLVNYTRGYLSKLENGLVPANPAVAKICDVALNAQGLLIQLADGERAMKLQPGRGKRINPAMLPAAPANFHRDDQCLEIVINTVRSPQRVQPGRVPTVVLRGIAGIGKTALALVAGHTLAPDFPDGCLFIDLRSYGEGEPVPTAEILHTFLRLLGPDAEDIPTNDEQRIALYRSILHDRRMLIVIDNARYSHQVSPLVPGAEGCAVLVTSRVAMPALNADAAVNVGPLTDSAALRILGADPGSPDPDTEKIAATCAGHALALRIAASLLEGNDRKSAACLAVRLAASSWPADVLRDGERELATTLHAALDSLPAHDSNILARLSQHPGAAIGVHAAAWLLEVSAGQAELDLARLHNSGLLITDSKARYGFHDLLAPLARGMRDSRSGRSMDETGLRHLINGHVHAVRAASMILAPHRFQPAPLDVPPAQPVIFDSRTEAVAWCFTELDNIIALIRLAFDKQWDTACWQLAYGMRDYFFLSKRTDSWILTHRLAVQAADREANRWASAVSHNNLGLGLVESGDHDAGSEHFRIAMRTFRSIDDRVGQAVSHGHQAWVSYCRGKYEHAHRQARQALRLYEAEGDRRGFAITLRTLGLIGANLPRADAEATYLQALEMFAELDLPFDQAMALNCLGELHLANGDGRRAAHRFAQAVRAARIGHSGQQQARGLCGLSDVAAHTDHADLAYAFRSAARDTYNMSLSDLEIAAAMPEQP